ncbi:hypothetical protein OG709_29850 [Streptomyces sp. NBC_01267]|uniref:hypothetical protein n=1 Tax=Streptomyces sp. NBC_01267 TaxID=2903805 RepID=UPI002E33E9E9|nr:hypothetical protein [Streptomyces sp. NBC_01267]
MALLVQSELEALTGRAYTVDQFAVIDLMTTDTIAGEVGGRLTDPPQPGVKTIALSLASRVLTNAGGVSSEQAGGMLISYFAGQIGKALSDDERRRLRRAVGLASGASSLNIAPQDTCDGLERWGAVWG